MLITFQISPAQTNTIQTFIIVEIHLNMSEQGTNLIRFKVLMESVYKKKRIGYCSVLWKVKMIFAVMLLLRKAKQFLRTY